MSSLLRVAALGEPEIGRPAPDRLVSGNPEHRTWTVEDAGDGLYSGIWESDVGAWRVVYTEWEFFHVLSGVSVLTGEDGSEVRLGPGDSYVVRPGFRGTWRVVEPTRKEFVVRL